MGYTLFTKELVEKVIKDYNPKSVIDLGAQNDFSGPNLPAPYISEWYKEIGIERYMCIDLNGENFAYKLDLSKYLPVDFINFIGTLSNGDPFLFSREVDLVGDVGTIEHIGRDGKFDWEASYICWCNKWNLLKKGGIMVNENPKTQSWVGHGFAYFTKEFYLEMEAMYPWFRIIELGEHAACHNYKDGWNIYCVLQKTSNICISFEQFKTLPLKQS